MGLLDSIHQPQQGRGGLLGGLLGAAGGQAPAPAQPQAGAQDLQLAMQLAQNPTMEMAQQIIAELKRSGNPHVAVFEQAIQQTGGDPALIKQIADTVAQKLSGGQ